MERLPTEEVYCFEGLVDVSFAATPLGQRAYEYFSGMFSRAIQIKQSYRGEAFTGDVAADTGVMFDRMIPLVIEAREFLETHAGVLVELWQISSDASTKTAYKTVLADVLAHSPGMQSKLMGQYGGDTHLYEADCYNAIQWLDGWLQSEQPVD